MTHQDIDQQRKPFCIDKISGLFVLQLTAVLLFGFLDFAHAKTTSGRIETNAAYIYQAPKWLTRNRAEKSIRRIERDLEWTIRRTSVHFHKNIESFQRAQSLSPFVTAVTINKGGQQTIHLGPKVTEKNFDQVFSHELVHVTIFQKYKTAIPKWLEEGLANHLARKPAVDYKWLSRQKLPDNVTKDLVHPLANSYTDAVVRYKASQALAEMLSKKCDLVNLLRLSVERKMQNYIQTYCEIPDINQAFKSWIKSKSK